MGNFLDVDVEVDWLYKGKRRPKTQPEVVRRERSSSVSNGSLGRVATRTESQEPEEPEKPKQTKPERPVHEAKRAGSSAAGIATAKIPQRSSSINETSGKSKKSLFGSLFRRNSQGSGEAPSIPIPLPKVRSHTGSAAATNQNSGQEAAPSMHAAVSQFLKEPSSPEVSDPAPIHDEKVVLDRSQQKKSIPINTLSKLPLKRVTFAVDRFGMDPPQQIPSRKPKKGDVLVPQDMICPTPSISVGITNTQGSVEQATSPHNEQSKEYKLAMEYHRRALKESEKHQQEAHYAARRIAHEVQNFKIKNAAASSNVQNSGNVAAEQTASNNDGLGTTANTTPIDDRIKNLEIDKPIHKHENFFDHDTQNLTSASEKLTLDKTYTRCCHLREILPIPSTLKQVKDKTAPLQTLKFLNPRPTLIDILSFCDFIAITPVHNVIFDNVNLTQEMLKIVISSLVNSSFIEKLGLRNVTFNADSWKLLCKFLLENKSLMKLDISHTKVKTDLSKELYRANMDWNLFIDVLRSRKGKTLDELLVNGVKFDNTGTFINLLNTFASVGQQAKKRLGIAQSEITGEQIKFLLPWVSENNIEGVDLGFNDLSQIVKPLVGKLTSLPYDNMHYFTLNSTNIASPYDAALVLRALSKLPNLYFLDLSNLPQIFPDIFPYLNKYLPRMPKLKRLHLDSNEFTAREVIMVTTVLSKCKELLHISLMNIPEDSFTTTMSANVYDCVRQSPKLTHLDIAYGNMPEEISSRIALFLMRRLHRDFELDDLASQDDLLFDGTLLSETAGNIFEKLNTYEDADTDTTRRYLLKKYWERFNRVHDNVQRTIDELFEKRSAGELNLQGKENLLRLLFLENNLSHILSILKTYPQVANIAGLDSSAKQSTFDNDVNNLRDVEPPAHTRPHLMATESGQTIDLTTGKAILVKQPSHVALVSKKQEEEEGEFHKWGFFVQQQNSIYPDHQVRTTVEDPVGKRPESSSSTESPKSSQPSTATQASHSLIAKIPSGTELRDAIMRAKGIDSIEELIENVSGNRETLDKIYGVPLHPMPQSVSEAGANRKLPLSQLMRSESNTSMSSSGSGDEEKVDETYDKLLNSLSKVRSNK
ncbi:LAFA_0B06326g1_1 [Lachancea sp. 'fantastica']|nr:LAFA_0B06326g1_1 [Lachancea sp. 'fantastica']